MKRILPAYPIFVKDPYFSFWAKTEDFGSESVIFWTGEEKGLYGILSVDGKPYTFLGKLEGVEAAKCVSLSLTAFTTDCVFEAGGVTLEVKFVSPLPPDDFEILSCPVCYMEYKIAGENAQVTLAMEQNVCYSPQSAGEVRGGIQRLDGFETAFFGKRKQAVFSHNEDRSCADWGYFYLAGERARYVCESEFYESIGARKSAFADKKYIYASACAQSGALMAAYDDVASVRYFGNVLKGYYLSDKTVTQALEFTRAAMERTDEKLRGYDDDLRSFAAEYGEEYRTVLIASLRQSIGAHKLVKNNKGEVLFLSKECYSNGCMATVDVTYPSSPLYLLYNPELLRGMLRPVFEFARMPVWKYDFAPHDVGTYPVACGQVYGMNEESDGIGGDAARGGEMVPRFDLFALPANSELYNFDSQMPVEESANILILLAALYRADGDLSLYIKNKKLLRDWAGYLVRYGLKPANQLCTDDFAGHLSDNVNLAIKATVGIACYAELCRAQGKSSLYSRYRGIAEDYAAQISALACGRDCLPLTWAGGDTFSLKYNLAFDKALSLGLFDGALCEKEADAYLKRANKYGVPLDNRKDYTKSDWLVWAATLTDDRDKRKKFAEMLCAYMRDTCERVPFGDWYDSVNARSIDFRNRSVQGGCFMPLLKL